MLIAMTGRLFDFRAIALVERLHVVLLDEFGLDPILQTSLGLIVDEFVADVFFDECDLLHARHLMLFAGGFLVGGATLGLEAAARCCAKLGAMP